MKKAPRKAMLAASLLIAGGAILAAAMMARCATPGKGEAMSEVTANEDLRARLTAEQYRVTQECGTEPPFANAYWNEHREGVYVDVVSGVPLFSSTDKFDSGTGWPSFTRPIDPDAVVEREDDSFGMDRIEVKSAEALSHLGHVFADGPGPDGLRYCINSAALRFVPAEKLEDEGYGELLGLFPGLEKGPGLSQAPSLGPSLAAERKEKTTPSASPLETAVFAAGCFWGTEEYFRRLPGVVSTEVGYAGGKTDDPTYKAVSSGSTGHAESLRLEFDPLKISYRDLLRHFFRMHDPTQVDRQGPDIGTQYRSAIFCQNEGQRIEAEAMVRELEASGRFKKPIATRIEDAAPFYSAEDYHQDYLRKNPGGYCHVDLGLASRPLD